MRVNPNPNPATRRTHMPCESDAGESTVLGRPKETISYLSDILTETEDNRLHANDTKMFLKCSTSKKYLIIIVGHDRQ